jgi:hypothetical protein
MKKERKKVSKYRKQNKKKVGLRFGVFTVVKLYIITLCVMTPCSLVIRCNQFASTHSLELEK